jgi:hypothetical protein
MPSGGNNTSEKRYDSAEFFMALCEQIKRECLMVEAALTIEDNLK